MTSQDLNFQYDFMELLYKQRKDGLDKDKDYIQIGYTVAEMEYKYSSRYNYIEFNFRRLKRKGYIENKNGDDYFTLTEKGITATELSEIHDEMLDKIDFEKSVNATLRSADASTLLSINQRSFNKSAKCLTYIATALVIAQVGIFIYQAGKMDEANEIAKQANCIATKAMSQIQETHIQLDSVLTDALSNNDTVFVKNLSQPQSLTTASTVKNP